MIKKTATTKIQGVVPSYAGFVIGVLIGIKGTNSSDVLGFIVNDWIAKSQSELDRIGASVENWKKEEVRKK